MFFYHLPLVGAEEGLALTDIIFKYVNYLLSYSFIGLLTPLISQCEYSVVFTGRDNKVTDG